MKRWRKPKKREGLGDLVAEIAQPIAELIDKVLKTDIKNCSGCAERKRTLNEYFPFKDE